MAARANIQACIDYAHVDVAFPGSTVEYDNWMTNMFTKAGFDALAVGSAAFWNKESVDERTVFNWIVPSLYFQRQLVENPGGAEQINDKISLVVQVLKAVQQAQDEGRITSDQESTVVACYNDAF